MHRILIIVLDIRGPVSNIIPCTVQRTGLDSSVPCATLFSNRAAVVDDIAERGAVIS